MDDKTTITVDDDDDDMSSLVEQLASITGADGAICERILKHNGSSLERAIDDYYTNQHLYEAGGSSGVSSGTSSEPEFVRAPIKGRQGVLIDESFEASYGTRRRRRFANSVFEGSRNLQEEAARQEEAIRDGRNPMKLQKQKDLSSLFAPPIDLIHGGDLDTAKMEAVRSNKWLLVNVQNVQEFSCQVLNRDIWSCPAIRDVVKNNFIFWQISDDSAHGRRFLSYYNQYFGGWPWVIILDPRTGEMRKQISTTDATAFSELLLGFLEQYPSFDHLDNHLTKVNGHTDTAFNGSTSCNNGNAVDDDVTIIEPETSGKKRHHVTNDDEAKPLPWKRFKQSDTDDANPAPDFGGDDRCDPDSEGFDIVVRLLPNGARSLLKLSSSAQLKDILQHCVDKTGIRDFILVLNFPRRVFWSHQWNVHLKALGFAKQETIHMERDDD